MIPRIAPLKAALLVTGILLAVTLYPRTSEAAITVDPGAMPVTGGTQWPAGYTPTFASSSGVQFQLVRNVRATSTSLRLLYLNSTASTTTFMASVRKGFNGTPEMVTVGGTTTIVMAPYSSVTSDVLSFSANTGDFIYDRSYFPNPLNNQLFSAGLIPGTYNPESISTNTSANGSNAVTGWATTTTNMLLVTDKSYEKLITLASLNNNIFGAYAVLGVPADSSLRLTTFVGDSKTYDALPDRNIASKPWVGPGMNPVTGSPYQNLAIAGDSLRFFVRPSEAGSFASAYALRLSLLTPFGGDFVNHYGTNSVGNFADPVAAAASELGYISELRGFITASSSGGKLYQATLDSTARKTATSSWTTVTEADQSGGGDNNNGVATSVYINNIFKFNKPSYIDGIIDLASVTMTPNGYWKANMTGDGIHQNNSGNAGQGALFRSLWPVPDMAFTSMSTSTASTTATFSWNTTRLADTRLSYGLVSSTYLASTTDAATTSSHTVNLSSLAPCTRYNYRIEGLDVYYVQSTSTQQSFVTAGCTGTAPVASSSDSVSITTASGGSFAFGSSTVTVPTGFTGTSSSAFFQAKSLSSTEFYTAAGTPTGKTRVGSFVLNLKAFTDATTTLSTFVAPISVTLPYLDADIAGVDVSSLKIQRYDAGTGWTELSGCTVDTSAKTVTCTTTHFSEFAIFGNASSASSGGFSTQTTIIGNTTYVTQKGITTMYTNGSVTSTSTASSTGTDSTATSSSASSSTTNTVVANVTDSGCFSGAVFSIVTGQRCPVSSSASVATTNSANNTVPVSVTLPAFTKNLILNAKSEDVRNLQKFLNGIGVAVSAAGAGSAGNETTFFGPATKAAVVKFQKRYGIVPTSGFFGPLTRAKANSMISR